MSDEKRKEQLAVAKAQVIAKVVSMRRSGHNYWDISKAVGLDTQTCRKIIKAHLQEARERLSEQADELLMLERDRLDALQAALWEKAMRGDTKAVDVLLRILSRRATMLGIDEPTKTRNEHYLGHLSDEEVEAQAKMMGIPVPVKQIEESHPVIPLWELDDVNESQGVGTEGEAGPGFVGEASVEWDSGLPASGSD